MSLKSRIIELSESFVRAFNSHDLEQVMAYFADDAEFTDSTGKTYAGKVAIREAFRPILDEKSIRVHFEETDSFVDEAAEKVATCWDLTIDSNGSTRTLTGLDLLHWKGDLLISKRTFTRTT